MADLETHLGFNRVVGLDNVVEIAAGGFTSFARTADGIWYSWGDNRQKQLSFSNQLQVLPSPTPMIPPCSLTGMHESNPSNALTITPLPASTHVTVSISGLCPSIQHVRIISLAGAEMQSIIVRGDTNIGIDTSNLSPGVYVVLVHTQCGEAYSRMLVKYD